MEAYYTRPCNTLVTLICFIEMFTNTLLVGYTEWFKLTGATHLEVVGVVLEEQTEVAPGRRKNPALRAR